MARRPAAPKAVDAMTDEYVRAIAEINRIIRANAKTLDFETNVAFQTAVVVDYNANGKPIYKQKRLSSGTPLVLDHMRMGASGWVYCFKPLDASEFKVVEYRDAHVVGVFPKLQDALIGALAEIIEDVEGVANFGDAWRRIRKMTAEDKKVAVAVRYKDNPKFGMF